MKMMLIDALRDYYDLTNDEVEVFLERLSIHLHKVIAVREDLKELKQMVNHAGPGGIARVMVQMIEDVVSGENDTMEPLFDEIIAEIHAERGEVDTDNESCGACGQNCKHFMMNSTPNAENIVEQEVDFLKFLAKMAENMQKLAKNEQKMPKNDEKTEESWKKWGKIAKLPQKMHYNYEQDAKMNEILAKMGIKPAKIVGKHPNDEKIDDLTAKIAKKKAELGEVNAKLEKNRKMQAEIDRKRAEDERKMMNQDADDDIAALQFMTTFTKLSPSVREKVAMYVNQAQLRAQNRRPNKFPPV